MRPALINNSEKQGKQKTYHMSQSPSKQSLHHLSNFQITSVLACLTILALDCLVCVG